MNYLITISTIINRIVKRELRKPKTIDTIKSITAPFVDINELFVAKAAEIDYKLLFNGQTIYLQHYLNDLYDNVLRRIYISNTAESNRVVIYYKSEGQAPLPIFFKSEAEQPVYLRYKSEPVTSNDFIVWVPVDVTYDEIIMRAQIDQFRQAGKLYTIQTF